MKGSYKNLFKKLLFTLQLRCSQFVSYGGGQLLISEVIDTQGSPSSRGSHLETACEPQLHETTNTPKDQTSLLVPTADSAEVELPEISNSLLDVGTSSSPKKSKECSTTDAVPEPAT